MRALRSYLTNFRENLLIFYRLIIFSGKNKQEKELRLK